MSTCRNYNHYFDTLAMNDLYGLLDRYRIFHVIWRQGPEGWGIARHFSVVSDSVLVNRTGSLDMRYPVVVSGMAWFVLGLGHLVLYRQIPMAAFKQR